MHSQKYASTHLHGDALVVFEGHKRLTWRAPNNGVAGLSSLWPNTAQRQSVAHHLSQQAPLLVIIDRDITPVPLLPEELPTLPSEARRLLEDEGGFPVLRIPLLDWLPESLRWRGSAFMAETDD